MISIFLYFSEFFKDSFLSSQLIKMLLFLGIHPLPSCSSCDLIYAASSSQNCFWMTTTFYLWSRFWIFRITGLLPLSGPEYLTDIRNLKCNIIRSFLHVQNLFLLWGHHIPHVSHTKNLGGVLTSHFPSKPIMSNLSSPAHMTYTLLIEWAHFF